MVWRSVAGFLVSNLRLDIGLCGMPVIEDDDILSILSSGDSDRFVEEVAFSRIERGSISPELLKLVVGEEGSDLEDEKKVFRSLREKSRDRLE